MALEMVAAVLGVNLGRWDEANAYLEQAVQDGVMLRTDQWPCSTIIEGLESDYVVGEDLWDTSTRNVRRVLEDNWDVIRDEVLPVLNGDLPRLARGQSGRFFKLALENLHDSRSWGQMSLWHQGEMIEPCAAVPKTCRLLREEIGPTATACRHCDVKFSAILPGTRVKKHTSSRNVRLRHHLGILIPEGVQMIVSGKAYSWIEGKVISLDDSFVHEVWHNGTAPRLVFIVDVIHPSVQRRIDNPQQYGKYLHRWMYKDSTKRCVAKESSKKRRQCKSRRWRTDRVPVWMEKNPDTGVFCVTDLCDGCDVYNCL